MYKKYYRRTYEKKNNRIRNRVRSAIVFQINVHVAYCALQTRVFIYPGIKDPANRSNNFNKAVVVSTLDRLVKDTF